MESFSQSFSSAQPLIYLVEHPVPKEVWLMMEKETTYLCLGYLEVHMPGGRDGKVKRSCEAVKI